jgi:hypothetical protein
LFDLNEQPGLIRFVWRCRRAIQLGRRAIKSHCRTGRSLDKSAIFDGSKNQPFVSISWQLSIYAAFRIATSRLPIAWTLTHRRALGASTTSSSGKGRYDFVQFENVERDFRFLRGIPFGLLLAGGDSAPGAPQRFDPYFGGFGEAMARAFRPYEVASARR